MFVKPIGLFHFTFDPVPGYSLFEIPPADGESYAHGGFLVFLRKCPDNFNGINKKSLPFFEKFRDLEVAFQAFFSGEGIPGEFQDIYLILFIFLM